MEIVINAESKVFLEMFALKKSLVLCRLRRRKTDVSIITCDEDFSVFDGAQPVTSIFPLNVYVFSDRIAR
jgi:hypothetical protein